MRCGHRHDMNHLDPGDIDLLVLDAHGVVFNNPMVKFLRDLGDRTGEGGEAVHHRWHTQFRTPFWEGRLGEDELWHRLAPSIPASELRNELECRYTPGPLFEAAAKWPRRLWILSNHRTDWLSNRLERFGIAEHFEQVLVSDTIGHAKPHPAAFCAVRHAAQHTSVFFIDDQPRNVTAARQLGIPAAVVVDTPALATAVHNREQVRADAPLRVHQMHHPPPNHRAQTEPTGKLPAQPVPVVLSEAAARRIPACEHIEPRKETT
jgi:HAD superfamily hydrolase (TIGR01509 family)